MAPPKPSPSSRSSTERVSDKVHNLRAIVADYRGLGEDLWFYRTFTENLDAASDTRLVGELFEAVREFEAVAARLTLAL